MTRNIGDPRFNPQLRNDGTLFGATGPTGDAFGLFTGTLTFQFGVPTLLAVTLAGTAEGSVVGQSASFDVSHSPYWAGINGVTINGQAVTDFSVSSDFGNRLVTVVCSGSGTLEHCPYDGSGTGSWLLVGDDRLRLARGAEREVAHAIDLVLRRVRFNGGMILPAGSLRAHLASSVLNSD